LIRLHVTQKLLGKLPLAADGRIRRNRSEVDAANDDVESLLSGWHANLIVMQRRQCVLFVHDTTRFPLFIPALKKSDFAMLDFLFCDALMNTLLRMGADEAVMRRAQAMLGILICDRTTDRSVQGTMNQIAQEIDHILWYRDVSPTELSPYRLNIHLAQTPRTVKGVKGCLWPIDEMFRLLGGKAPDWTKEML